MKYKKQTKIIVGLQWGDEGKGKIVNFLSSQVDIVVRYQGGNNAGHTIKINKEKFILNHLPSGILNPKVVNVITQGMVINPKLLINEINALQKKGFNNFNLLISDRSHIIMPYHLDLDNKYEDFKEKHFDIEKIGTTKKGIGPTYEDKVARIGIRFGDLINKDIFTKILKNTLMIKNKQLEMFGIPRYKFDDIFNEYFELSKKLKKYNCQTSEYLAKNIINGKSVIFEGAQGAMLCLENGVYPYVTSSSPTATSVPLNTGLNLSFFNEIIGVVKAYTTRVGNGFMVSDIEKENFKIASHIRRRGNEFGSVTVRPRRIGWLDIVVLKHTIRTSGASSIALTLLDVLTGIHEIKIVISYKKDQKIIDYIPSSFFEFEKCKPIYLTMKGWDEDISNIKKFKNLPQNAKQYIEKIENLIGIPITIISVGPEQKQTIVLKDLFT